MLVSHSELIAILREWEARYWNVIVEDTNRYEERFSIKWRTRVAVVNKSVPNSLEFDEGYAMNISLTGLGLITRCAISVGEWCLCLFYPPHPDAPFVVLGQAVWQKPINEVFATGLICISWQDEQEFTLAIELAKKEKRTPK